MGEWIILKGCPQQTKNSWWVKGRNLIESICYKRKVATVEKRGPRGGGKNRERKKNTKRRRPNGGKHLRGKTHRKRVVSTQREVPRKRKDQKEGTTHGRRVIRN